VTIPPSVTAIGGGPFFSCTKLTQIAVDPINPNYTSAGGVLFNKAQSLLIQYPAGRGGSYVIPTSVTSIGDYGFSSCSGLTGVVIPDKLTFIGKMAFSSCSKLTSMTFLGNAPAMYSCAFSHTNGATVYFNSTKSGFSIPTWQRFQSVALATTREIVVEYPAGTHLVDGSASAVPGSMAIGNAEVKTLTIRNLGVTDLTGLAITTDGPDAAYFTVSSLATTTLKPGAETTFTVTFAPAASGLRTAAIHLASNDADENPFDISLTGLGIGQPPVSPAITWLLANGFTTATNLLSDPNADGVCLLMAYALNLNPHLNLSGSVPRPVVTANQMSLTFYAGNPDVNYLVETSTDLRVWTDAGITISSPDANGLRTATFPKNGPRRFMRLTVRR
jgi:hypothetical protein